MAGIGEASAILAVAQIGFVLSTTLIAYIGEVKGAHSRISSVGNEIQTTSERLKEIGQLVEKNRQNPILSQASITSAVRCSSECRDIIDDVKKILCKSEWPQKSEAPEKDEIDISLFSRLRWPIVKRRLEIPRVELQRIKIDLLLIFSAAMAFTASTTVEQEIYKQNLPKLKRTRSWAAKRSEQAKRRARRRSLDPRRRRPYKNEEEEEDDDDEKDGEEKNDDNHGYGSDNDDRITILSTTHGSADRKKGQSEEDPGILHEKPQRKRAESPMLEVMVEGIARKGAEGGSTKPIKRGTPSNLAPQLHLGESATPDPPGEAEKDVGLSKSNGRSWCMLQGWWSKKNIAEKPSERSVNLWLSENNLFMDGTRVYETWMIDMNTLRRFVYSPSREWLARKLSNPKRDRDLRDCVTKMKPSWKAAVFGFTTEFGTSSSPFRWTLYHIELSQRPSKTHFLGHNQNDPLVLVIFCARSDDMVREGVHRIQAMHMQGHGEHRQLPPPPPDHGHHEGGGGHGGADPRMMPMGPGRGHGGGHGGWHDGGFDGGHGGGHGRGHDEFLDDDGSDESEHKGHHGDYGRGRGRSYSRRTPSRHRWNYYSDDSDDESEYERYRIIRPRSESWVTRGLPRMGNKSRKRVSETKQSDAEIIDQLLREYTTFGDGNAVSASVPSAPLLTTTNNEPGPTSSPIEQASMNGRVNAVD